MTSQAEVKAILRENQYLRPAFRNRKQMDSWTARMASSR
jgi:hypothetical protein